jgi:hypothetical protein
MNTSNEPKRRFRMRRIRGWPAALRNAPRPLRLAGISALALSAILLSTGFILYGAEMGPILLPWLPGFWAKRPWSRRKYWAAVRPAGAASGMTLISSWLLPILQLITFCSTEFRRQLQLQRLFESDSNAARNSLTSAMSSVSEGSSRGRRGGPGAGGHLGSGYLC